MCLHPAAPSAARATVARLAPSPMTHGDFDFESRPGYSMDFGERSVAEGTRLRAATQGVIRSTSERLRRREHPATPTSELGLGSPMRRAGRALGAACALLVFRAGGRAPHLGARAARSASEHGVPCLDEHRGGLPIIHHSKPLAMLRAVAKDAEKPMCGGKWASRVQTESRGAGFRPSISTLDKSWRSADGTRRLSRPRAASSASTRSRSQKSRRSVPRL